MKEEERNRKIEILKALKRREHERELQRAKLGVNADPVIFTELEEIKQDIKNIEQEINTLVTSMNIPNLNSQGPVRAYAKLDIKTRKAVHLLETASDDILRLRDKVISYIEDIDKRSDITDILFVDWGSSMEMDIETKVIMDMEKRMAAGTHSLVVKSKDVGEICNALTSFVNNIHEESYSSARKRKRKQRKNR